MDLYKLLFENESAKLRIKIDQITREIKYLSHKIR